MRLRGRLIDKVRGKIALLAKRGFFHIFVAGAISKLIAFFSNIAIVWFLTKDDYGVFSYANNVYTIIALFTGFGLLTGLFQFCLEKRPSEEVRAISWYVLSRGMAIDVCLSAAIMTSMLFVSLPIESAGKYLGILGPMLVLDYAYQYCAVVLRVRLENALYSALQVTYSLSYLILACSGAAMGGIGGTIVGRYLAYALTIALASFFLRRIDFSLRARSRLSRAIRADLWRYSTSTQVSSALNTFTYLLDVFLVGLFIAEAASVATYKVATLIPEGLLFIPGAVITFAMPYFVKHNRDRGWTSVKSRYLLGGSFVLYGALAALLILFAHPIILLLWGEAYLDAVLPFRLLALSFLFSAMRTTCTNLLCTLRAIRSNLVISVLSLIVNVVLCIALIPSLGIAGAASAPLIVSIVAFGVAALLLARAIHALPEEGLVDA